MKGRRVRWLITGVFLVALGSLALFSSPLRFRYAMWTGDRVHGSYTAKLEAEPVLLREDVVPSVAAFSGFLAERGIKLRIVLLPKCPMILQGIAEDGTGPAQTAPEESGRLHLAASERLGEVGLAVVDPWRRLHRSVARFPDKAHFLHINHYHSRTTDLFVAEMLPMLETDWASGDVMLVGDCVAEDVVRGLRRAGRTTGIRTLWKNASSNLMAHETTRLPEGEFEGVVAVYWLLSSHYLARGREKTHPFPGVAIPSEAGSLGEWTVAKLAAKTEVDPELGTKAPYPDALVMHRFEARDGEHFLGLHPVLNKHQIDEAVRRWNEGASFRLRTVPLEEAERNDPRLKTLQILDDTQDFVSPRYWIEEWVHMSSP